MHIEHAIVAELTVINRRHRCARIAEGILRHAPSIGGVEKATVDDTIIDTARAADQLQRARFG